MDEFYNYFKTKYNVNLIEENDDKLLNAIFYIGGQEGIDFLDDFLIHFNIEVERIEYKDHFSSEGFGFGFKKFRSKAHKPLKIKHLKNAFIKKKWSYFE